MPAPVECWLRLYSVPGIGPVRLKQWLSRCSLAQLAANSVDDWRRLGWSERQCAFWQQESLQWVAHALAWRDASSSHHILTPDSPAYPPLLQQLPDAPVVLFIQGSPEVLLRPQLAMVGSRDCTPYGKQWGHYFAAELARSGMVITSGLALGIDACCHQAALEVSGLTVAVLGSGLQKLYPRQHQRLAQQIVAQQGALVSEFFPWQAARPEHFPRRNRIISGLAVGLLVVEATEGSGSLISARYALDQGREVFALPGAIGSGASRGCHQLIQQGAWLVESPADIQEQLGSLLCWVNEQQTELIASTEAQQLPFAKLLATVTEEVTPVDVVAERAGQPVAEVLIQLLELELAGWIAAVPGGYVRIRRTGHVRRIDVPI